jgi:uracil-DNA glycosylase
LFEVSGEAGWVSRIGQRFQYFHNQSIEVYVNFHPAYILRNEKTLFKKYSDDLALLIKNCL